MPLQAEQIAALVSMATVSLLHTLLPSHWLCFALAGKARSWSRRRTLAVTALAGGSHALSTIALGIAALLLGRSIFPEESMETVSALLLAGIGIVFLLQHLLGKGHRHEEDLERMALAMLVLTPTLSPCTAVIPMFLVVAGGGVLMVALVSATLVVTTIGAMLLLVSLTSLGVDRIRFAFLSRYEKAVIGAILCLLGVLILLFHE